MRLENKVAIVTGSSRGIGLGIAEGFIKEGCKVAICGTKLQNAENTVKKLREKYSDCDIIAVEINIANIKSIEEGFKKVIDKYGTLDILVNNAGITHTSSVLKTTDEDFDRVMNINTTGTFRCTREALKYMKKGASIINTTSMNGIYGAQYQSAYSASKGALIAMTKAMAKELGPQGIRVNAIAPGMIKTDMVEEAVSEEMKRNLINLTPLRRMGEVEDLQGITILLASEESSFITSTVISVDGGILM